MDKKHWIILGLMFILMILFDQYTKDLAQVIPNYQRWWLFNFNLKFNTGVFLGFFQDLSPTIRMVGISIMGVFILLIYTSLQYFLSGSFILFRHGMNFFVAGIFGNVIDRILRGHIVDFLAIGKGRYKTAVFNFADIFLWVGVFIIVYVIIFESKKLIPEQSNRKRYIINKEFQYKHTFTFVAICLAFCLVNIVLTFTFFNYAIEENLSNQILPVFKGYLLLFTIFSLLFIIFIFCIGIVSSNRIAGPIYAFKRFLGEFREGKEKPLNLREGDDFKELEDISKDIISLFSGRNRNP